MKKEIFEIVKPIVNKLRISTVFLFLVMVSLFFIFSPENWLGKLCLLELKEKYNTFISLSLIISMALLLTLYFEKKYQKYKLCIVGKRYIKNKMSSQENRLLVERFYNSTLKEFNLLGEIAYNCGSKKPLEMMHIIYRSSNMSAEGSRDLFEYNLNPYILHFFNKKLKKGKISIENNFIKFK